jgi:hypothetical protein
VTGGLAKPPIPIFPSGNPHAAAPRAAAWKIESGKWEMSGKPGAKKEELEAEGDRNEQSQFPFTPLF